MLDCRFQGRNPCRAPIALGGKIAITSLPSKLPAARRESRLEAEIAFLSSPDAVSGEQRVLRALQSGLLSRLSLTNALVSAPGGAIDSPPRMSPRASLARLRAANELQKDEEERRSLVPSSRSPAHLSPVL